MTVGTHIIDDVGSFRRTSVGRYLVGIKEIILKVLIDEPVVGINFGDGLQLIKIKGRYSEGRFFIYEVTGIDKDEF